MSLVTFGTSAADPETILDYPDGGVFVPHADGSGLGSVTLTLEVYTQVHQGSAEVLYDTYTLVGPTPADPAVLVPASPIVSALSTRMVLSGASGIPFWIESVGQVSTVENGEGDLLATGSEQTLVEVLYPGKFMLLVDRTVMASGDDLKLRLKSLRGLTYLTTLYSLLEDAAPSTSMIARLGPIVVPEACLASLHQSAGSVESWPFALLELGR